MGWYGRFIPRGQAIVLAYLLWAVATGAMGLSTNYGMLVVTGFWVGLANMLMFVNVATLMMEHTPQDKIGRAITVRQVGVSVVRVCALLGFGWMADLVGVREAILAMAGISLLGSVVVAVRFPALWQYRIGDVLQVAKKEAEVPREAAEAGVVAAISRLIRARDDPEFIVSEQRWLNAASLAIVVTGWLILLLTLPTQALGLAGAVAGVAGVASLVRWGGQRLRARGGGHDSDGGGTSPHSEKQESEAGQRNTRDTGPTA
jgi:MFS family permease